MYVCRVPRVSFVVSNARSVVVIRLTRDRMSSSMQIRPALQLTAKQSILPQGRGSLILRREVAW